MQRRARLVMRERYTLQKPVEFLPSVFNAIGDGLGRRSLFSDFRFGAVAMVTARRDIRGQLRHHPIATAG